MKVTVRRRFRDRDTLQILNIGDVAEYDNERAIELARGRFVSIYSEDVPDEEDETPNADDDNEDTGKDSDFDTSEKKEVEDEDTEKNDTSHTPKAETTRPNKPGRKARR